MDTLYLEGYIMEDHMLVSTASVVTLYVLQYCKSKNFDLVITPDVPSKAKSSTPISIPLHSMHNVKKDDKLVENTTGTLQCTFPAIKPSQKPKILSGLCCVLRNVIKSNDHTQLNLLKLLSHKEICLKACAEVSAWTKFCEVEMPNCVSQVLETVRTDKSAKITIPEELLRLENQFKQPVVMANINKRRLNVQKQKNKEDTQPTDEDLPDRSMSTKNHMCDLQHLFVEGADLTLSDLVLFPLIMCLLQHWQSQLDHLHVYLPLTLQWCKRLLDLPDIREAIHQAGLPCVDLSTESSPGTPPNPCEIELPPPDIGPLSIRESKKKKFKANSSDLMKAMEKLKDMDIPECFTCDDVQLPWEQLPEAVHPKDGDLPPDRLQRKCQQLENLAQAVANIAEPGHTVVDFCSGGGHLGILLAYMLPDCKIILVENKEASIQKAEKRIAKLKLGNITIYQCNLDYFHGKFDIGTCLHACGVATDLVLQCCLDNLASFVICPCCYGNIQNTHTISYPRSEGIQKRNLTYKEYLCLGHGGDQTQFNTAVAKQGKQCMIYIDTDRAALAQEHGYKVTLSTLLPAECSPKNNLLIGTKTL